MAYHGINAAHGELVEAVREITNPGYEPIPITVVSVTDHTNGQLVVFDGTKFAVDEIVRRLRLAADFIESQAPARKG